ncbi:hypothetical protein [Nocardioides sp.]|uniref:hypothetical protein n=1 Tax=Nocardioides sp. TaxID=35761 RepID=UPI0035185F6A
MSAPVTAGDRAREVLARVAWENAINCTGPGEVGCRGRKGWHSWTEHYAHVAAEQVKALTEAGLLVEGVERVEWGMRGPTGGISLLGSTRPDDLDVNADVRRNVTTYPDRVTEWEEVE